MKTRMSTRTSIRQKSSRPGLVHRDGRGLGRGGALVAILLLALPGGCTSLREYFVDAPPEQVWSALVAVAREPDYEHPDPGRRWTVTDNNVWVDESHGRIEIERKLDRVMRVPAAAPQRERREWQFQITFYADDHPNALFISRRAGLPIEARLEAERYFDAVHAMLGTKTRRRGVATLGRENARVIGTDVYWDEH